MKSKILIGLTTCLIIFGIVSLSSATTMTYSDRISWELATSGITTVGFEGIAPDNSFVSQGTNTTIEGVNFSSHLMFVIGKDYAESGGVFNLGTGAILFGHSVGIYAGGIGDITSFGIDLRGYDEAFTTFNLTLSTGDSFPKTVTNPTGGFFGVTSDVAFSSILIDPTTSFIIMDNFSFGEATAIPEPATMLLLGTGLVGVAGAARRKKKNQT